MTTPNLIIMLLSSQGINEGHMFLICNYKRATVKAAADESTQGILHSEQSEQVGHISLSDKNVALGYTLYIIDVFGHYMLCVM